jgi:hypothetical protein
VTLFFMKDGDGAEVSQGVAFLMTLDEYDCVGGPPARTRHLYLQSSNQSGWPVEKTPEPQPWDVIVPGSNADIEGRLICDDAFRSRDEGISANALDMLRATRRATSGASSPR